MMRMRSSRCHGSVISYRGNNIIVLVLLECSFISIFLVDK
jgi:hypothetical protein